MQATTAHTVFTGIEHLDAFIAQQIHCDKWLDNDHTLQHMRDGEISSGECQTIAGIIAYRYEKWMRAIGKRRNSVHACESSGLDAFNPFSLGPCTLGIMRQAHPNLLGYADRPRIGTYGGHVVTIICWAKRTFMIDFTASQYGYDAWPMIQEICGNRIMRLTNGEWHKVGEYDAEYFRLERENNARNYLVDFVKDNSGLTPSSWHHNLGLTWSRNQLGIAEGQELVLA